MDPHYIYKTKDDFPEHLRRYVYKTDNGFFSEMFHHPLLVVTLPMMFFSPVEEMLTMREESVVKALGEGRWQSAIWRHERAYRMSTLLEYLENGTIPTATKKNCLAFWQEAASIWVDAEFNEDDYVWTQLMECDVPYRWGMTLSKDRRALRQMPDTLTIYKGIQAEDEMTAEENATVGWSWTLDPKVARKFALRHKPDELGGYVVTYQNVPKSYVVAYLTGRSEEEILIEPYTVNFPDIIEEVFK